MKRNTKRKIDLSVGTERRTTLRLVPPLSDRKPLEAFYIFFSVSFFIFSGVVITLLLSRQPLGRHNLTYWEVQVQDANSRFTSLQKVYTENGLEEYKKQKALLKTQLQKIVENIPDTKAATLNSIILYLFPEMLAEEDFEKSVAMEQWGELQNQIETETSWELRQKLFASMKAHVWNYENSDKLSPHITDTATRMLSLFESLSLGGRP